MADQTVVHADHQGGGCVNRHRVGLGHRACDPLGILQLFLGEAEELPDRGDSPEYVVAATVIGLHGRADELVGGPHANESLLADYQRREKLLSGDVRPQAGCREQARNDVFTDVARFFVKIAAVHRARHRPDRQCRLRRRDAAAIERQDGLWCSALVFDHLHDRRDAVHARAADHHGHTVQQGVLCVADDVLRQIRVAGLHSHAAQSAHRVF